jgi:pimeloyl-ACP methyl ester carboxylesterase
VAHSGGAAVAVELAVRRPDLVAAVAALDGTLGFPAELLEQTAPLLAALRGPAWCEVIAGFVAAGFLPLTTRTCSAAPSRTSSSCPQHVVAGVGERIAASDAEAALAAFGATGTPLRYVRSGATWSWPTWTAWPSSCPTSPWAGSSAWATTSCWPPQPSRWR